MIIQLDNSKDGSILIGHSLLGKTVEVRIYKDDNIWAIFESDVKLSGIRIQRGFFSDTDTYEMRIFYGGQLVDSQIFKVIDYDEDFCFSPAPSSDSGSDLEDLGNLLNLKQNKVIESGEYKGQEIETVIDKLQPKTNQEGKTIDERFEEVNKDLNEKQSKTLEDGTTIQENLDNLQDDLNTKVSNTTFEEQNEIFAEDIETAFEKIEELENRPSGGTHFKPLAEQKIDEMFEVFDGAQVMKYQGFKWNNNDNFNDPDSDDTAFFNGNIIKAGKPVPLYKIVQNSDGSQSVEVNPDYLVDGFEYVHPDDIQAEAFNIANLIQNVGLPGGFYSFIVGIEPTTQINSNFFIYDPSSGSTFEVKLYNTKDSRTKYHLISIRIQDDTKNFYNVYVSQEFYNIDELVKDIDITGVIAEAYHESIGFKKVVSFEEAVLDVTIEHHPEFSNLDDIDDKINSLSSVMETTQVKQININPLDFAKNSIIKNDMTGDFSFVSPYYTTELLPGDNNRFIKVSSDKDEVINYYKSNPNTTGSNVVVLFGKEFHDSEQDEAFYPIDLNDPDNFGEYLISVPKGDNQIRAFMYIDGRLHITPILKPTDLSQNPIRYPIVPHTWTFEKVYNRDIHNYLLNFLEEAHQSNPILKEFIKSLATGNISMKYITEADHDETGQESLLVGRSLTGKQNYGQEAVGAQSYGFQATGSQSYGLQSHGNQSYAKGAGGAISFGEASWVNVDAKSAAVEHFFGKQLKTEYVGGKTYFATSTDGENWTKTTHTADELIKHLDTLITS